MRKVAFFAQLRGEAGEFVLVLRRHAFEYQIFHLGPNVGIALALHVIGSNVTVEPGKSLAGDRSLVVIETVVAQDAGFGIVHSLDFRAAVDNSMWLVQVDGRGNVPGNEFVVLPGLRHAIDLSGQQHGDTHAVEFSRQHDDGACTPALAEEHDVSRIFFLLAQHSVVIGVEQAKDRLERGFAMAVLENLDVGVLGGILLEAMSNLDWAMMRVGMTDETADETDQDIRRTIGNGSNGSSFGSAKYRSACARQTD